MKFRIYWATVCTVLLLGPSAFGQNLVEMDARPLYERVKQRAGSVSSSAKVQVPVITWGGDVATIYALQAGMFKANGLDVALFAENNFPKQVEACLSGKTPYLRGTMGMINAAAQAFEKQGIQLNIIYQLTWSTGGDALVSRDNIKAPKDLKNKTVALQLYGPHMDYLSNLLGSAGVSPDQVKLKWFKELTLPTYDTGGKIVDPVNAFLLDDSIDAVTAIIPDALTLTSGGERGTGADGSVKGARLLLSTRTASRVIADVYAVRGDYLAQHRDQVQGFVKSLLQAQEGLQDLKADAKKRTAVYQQLMSKSADLLLGAPQAVPDVEALLGDCEFVGFDGNLSFFTGKGTTRNMEKLNSEIQSGLLKMGLMDGKVMLKSADWDYNQFLGGLRYASKKPTAKKKFDAQKVANKIEKQISVEPTSWAEDGTLFQVEINFAPNQSEFSSGSYADDFQKALEIAQTYGGSLIVVEGHSDPLGVLRARKAGKASIEVRQMEQQAKNLSLDRSVAVRKSFLAYCKTKGIAMDESQFISVGLGTTTPKYNPPRTKDEWAANRRVVFRVKQVEAELSEFAPLD